VTARSDLARRLGARVAQLRRELKLRQKQFSEAARTSDKVISQLERGVSVPHIEKLADIAAALHTTLQNLFDFAEEGGDRRQKALARINNMLRGRREADLVAVREILRLVFAIKRRERPEPPPPRKRQPRKRQ
jgi:transcriptional regulator with XRE-family HTH domain